MEIREVKITRILNPTSIDLGEYVINPFKGCAFSCLYCYVRYNKVTLKDKRNWGDFVDIRSNAPELLEKELSLKKPQCVLLGSTTECFQPVEKKWFISRKIIEILNKHQVFYTILTRSPFILDVLPLLKEGFCRSIYFTINWFDEALKILLEPKSPPFQERISAIQVLLNENIKVIPYFAPLLPFVCDFREIFQQLEGANCIEFESLNFNLGNIRQIIESIGNVYPQWKTVYEKMASDQKTYHQIFSGIKKEIIKEAGRTKKNHRIFIHNFCSYFENTYVS